MYSCTLGSSTESLLASCTCDTQFRVSFASLNSIFRRNSVTARTNRHLLSCKLDYVLDVDKVYGSVMSMLNTKLYSICRCYKSIELHSFRVKTWFQRQLFHVKWNDGFLLNIMSGGGDFLCSWNVYNFHLCVSNSKWLCVAKKVLNFYHSHLLDRYDCCIASSDTETKIQITSE